MCADLNPLSHLKRLQVGIFGFLPKETGAKSVFFVMYISSAKFEEHCSNISGDNLDRVLHCFSGTTYDVIIFLLFIVQKRIYL